MPNKSVMQHKFSEISDAEIPRSSFNRSHGLKTTFDAMQLIPIFMDEALPGDTMKLNMTAFARLATPLHPFMDNLFLNTFFFAVPNRLLWDNWEKFNGAQDNPADSTDFLVPTLTSPGGGYLEQTIFDYLGLPTKIAALTHNVLHNRAYNLIVKEWFRDQNIQNSPVINTDDGPDAVADYAVFNRPKRHDYFTSALPWPQKGTAVSLPLGTSAPILGIGSAASIDVGGPSPTITETGGATSTYTKAKTTHDGTANKDMWFEYQADGKEPAIYADLTNATAATINQMREAFQIQKIYERDARGGTRYTEMLRSHFGVTSPDARLQRPEYLGGGQSAIVVNQVAQTSETLVGTPQGNLTGYGTSLLNNHGFTKSFTEHCTLIGLVSLRADLTYQQGLHRMYSRSTRWDYYWPAFAGLGEQSILNKEIFSDASANDELIFGYQERYAEYRYKPSIITGLHRSNAAASLDTWHLSEDFSALPALNATFLLQAPPVDRVIAVPAEPHIIFDAYFDFQCTRPMPMYGVPGYIDHF